MEQKTFEQVCFEISSQYGRQDFRKDFEIGAGLNKLMSEEDFFCKCAERYANYKAAIAFNEGCKAQREYQVRQHLLSEHGKCTEQDVKVLISCYSLVPNYSTRKTNNND